MWVHFESMHILQQPTYMSMYPPGQGLILALGQYLWHPWFGVILSCLAWILLALWAARQWMPPRWSALCGLLALLSVSSTYWSTTYWGGAWNAAAGAMVLGATGALSRRPSRMHFVTFGAGTGLCSITRPYEGLVLVLGCGAYLLYRFWKSPSQRTNYAVAAIPSFLVLACFAAFQLLYNHAVTGHSLRMPYLVARNQYSARRMFLFQNDPPAPNYRYKYIGSAYGALRRLKGSRSGILLWNIKLHYWRYYKYPILYFFFFSLLAFHWRARYRARFPIFMAYLGIAAVLLLPFIHLHYYAPFAAAFAIACADGSRRLINMRLRGRRVGWISTLLLTFAIAWELPSSLFPESDFHPRPWPLLRARVENKLVSSGGRHLILVRYSPGHNWNHEWVYNAANIDESTVVWARTYKPESDAALLRYFASRQRWFLDADQDPPKLTPIP
jgi:hypothetical protein